MAICNIFKTLQKTTGTFLTFSQYAEDLTKHQTLGNVYRVVPSKYIAINGNYNDYDNWTLAKSLQDQFENACACFKSNQNDDPNIAKGLFWNFMSGNNIIQLSAQNNSSYYVMNGVQYVGDINLQSYDEHNDTGYSEIYCHIPNNAQMTQYTCEKTQDSKYQTISVKAGDLIQGYQDGELHGWEKLGDNYDYCPTNYNFSWDEDTDLISTVLTNGEFVFNTIVVLYDIYNDEDNILYAGLPMGIYFCGLLENVNGVTTLSNPVTKFVAHDDIYNSGTSYSLRICTRFSVDPQNDNLTVKEVSMSDNNYADLTRVLSELSETQNRMNKIINQKHSETQYLKDTLAIFMNSRTNVPYIKNVNGKDYWFVNGRLVNPIDECCIDNDSYTDSEIDNILYPNLKIDLSSNLNDLNDITVFEPTTVTLTWTTTYKDVQITPTKLYISIDGTEQEINAAAKEHTFNIQEAKKYEITLKAKYRGLEQTQKISISYIYPSYFGLLSCGDDLDTRHDTNVTVDQIKSLDKYLLTSKNTMFDVNTSELKHVVYAYPAEFGELETIVGKTGYIYYLKSQISEEFNDFKKLQMNIDNKSYFVYMDKAPVIIENQKLKFK